MKKKYIHSIIIGLGIGATLSLVYWFGFFANWQDSAADKLFPPRSPSSEIRIISIDDKSIQAIGRWPWDRSAHARLLEILGRQPAAIGYDVSFPEASNQASDQKLAQALRRSGRVVLPVEANNAFGDTVSLKNLLVPIVLFQAEAAAGLVDMVPDKDSVTRFTPIAIRSSESKPVRNFSVEILDQYFHNRNLLDRLADLERIPLTRGYLRINYVGRPSTFPTYSFVDVLNGKVAPAMFANKIVLVGATAPDLHDNQLTPVSQGLPMSGVEIHANVIQTILTQKYLLSESRGLTLVVIFAISIFAAFIFIIFNLIPGAVALFIIVFAYIVYAILAFDNGTIRNLIFPVFACVIAYFTTAIYRYYVENRQKRFIRKAFSYYVSASVMKELLDNPSKLSLGGERKEITVLFSDVAGFTTISEKLPAETLANLLNHYLTRMTRLVFKYNGVLDKFIGDAVMAFWGAPVAYPDHALLACQTAIEMQTELQEIRKQWEEMNISDFDVRIGINTGEMVVGNMGSDMRFDYTLLGDNVNLGSRLEGINKEYGTHIVISGATYAQVKDKVIARRLDTVAVKGKAHGVTIYELRGLGTATTEEKNFLEAFEAARKQYHQGDFAQALKDFQHLHRQYPDDKTIVVYVKRCEEFVKAPPPHWDGVFYATSK